MAETSEEFMDKFFGGEDFTYAEMIQGLRSLNCWLAASIIGEEATG